jgi:hypothetical protein
MWSVIAPRNNEGKPMFLLMRPAAIWFVAVIG